MATRRVMVSLAAATLICAATTACANAQAKDLDEYIRDPVPTAKSAPTEAREKHQTITDAFDLSIELSQDQALWTALAFEDADQVRSLLRKGANPNRAEELSLMTPLMAAETMPITVALLQYGADPNARDRMGRSVLHYAVTMRDAASIVPLLIRSGVNINMRTDDTAKITALFCAMDKYIEDKDKDVSAQIIRVLVDMGADLNILDGHGANPLAVAASRNQVNLLRLLIQLGADPAMKLPNGRTALDYARDANAVDAMHVLANLPVKAQPANN